MNKELQIAGKKIFYRVFGERKPAMLLHGFGETGEVWNHQIGILKSHFKLIVPDLPGTGESEMVRDMSMGGMAEVINAIFEEEAENTKVSEAAPVLIGHSMGGYVTLAYVKLHPGSLRGFGLFHSTAFADNNDKKEVRKKGIDFIRQHGAFEFLKSSVPNLFSPTSKAEKSELIDVFIRGLNNFSASALVSYYEAMMQRPDTTDLLKVTSLPVLFVIGKYDTPVPMEDTLKQTHLPEKSYIHILHQSGHMGMLEEPDTSTHILKKFLDEI
jgi:pimeloyl-ACP methyl ester carboxylesterase